MDFRNKTLTSVVRIDDYLIDLLGRFFSLFIEIFGKLGWFLPSMAIWKSLRCRRLYIASLGQIY